MTSFIPHLHTDLRQARLTRRGATHDPKDVPTGVHKEYPRMERIELPRPSELQTTFAEALQKRQSCFKTKEAPLSLDDWGTLLGLALKKRDDSKHRNYPSGGALYPVETYLFAHIQSHGAPSAFHYNPSAHALEHLWHLPESFKIKTLVPAHNIVTFSSLMVFTAVWPRTSAKYGDYAYNLALLEAGHLSQNVLLAATALGLKSRPMTAFDGDLTAQLLDLDDEIEQSVHSVVLSA